MIGWIYWKPVLRKKHKSSWLKSHVKFKAYNSRTVKILYPCRPMYSKSSLPLLLAKSEFASSSPKVHSEWLYFFLVFLPKVSRRFFFCYANIWRAKVAIWKCVFFFIFVMEKLCHLDTLLQSIMELWLKLRDTHCQRELKW